MLLKGEASSANAEEPTTFTIAIRKTDEELEQPDNAPRGLDNIVPHPLDWKLDFGNLW